jgi:hypothetical protein
LSSILERELAKMDKSYGGVPSFTDIFVDFPTVYFDRTRGIAIILLMHIFWRETANQINTVTTIMTPKQEE